MVQRCGELAWPPEKPTAITPSSLSAERNFGGIVEGDVILAAFEIDCREAKLFQSEGCLNAKMRRVRNQFKIVANLEANTVSGSL